MKHTLIGLIAGIILATAGVAGATGEKAQSKQFVNNGVLCKAAPGGGAMCLRTDGRGYGVGITRDFVLVLSENNKRVFVRFHDSN